MRNLYKRSLEITNTLVNIEFYINEVVGLKVEMYNTQIFFHIRKCVP